MCGIVGYVGSVENREKVLTDMMDTIIHRGPDSSGSYIDEEAALGFRRLSIIDLSKEGDQPLYNEDRSLVLTFNGEIYNYQDLRKELIEAGHVFYSNTDSETLIHGYEEWGEELLSKLRGMYAFVIWDRNRKKLFGARDIFGIKPLYYALMNDTFLYASEIKAFLPHPNYDKVFNEEALGNYLTYQFVPTNETFFRGVFCLPPGHSFVYHEHNLTISRYFEPDFTNDCKLSFDKLVDQVEDIMKNSVSAHMISDVEVASYLSSGVDSSYLAHLGQVDHTFTVGFDEGKYSEIQEARLFADTMGIENASKIITPEEYWDNLSDIQYYMDEPVADPSAIALYFLSEEAAKKVKVVLSGEGSDELFGGYVIYCEPLEHRGFDIVPFPIRKFLGWMAERVLPHGMKGRGFLMRHGKKLEDRYYSNATSIFTAREAGRILRSGIEPDIQSITRPLYARVKGKDPVTKMQYVDLHVWLVHDILMKGDKMGMANSVEVRVPFLDKEVLKVCETLPLDYKVVPPKTKLAIRAAAEREIPEKTARKKKLGFPIPTRVWLREEKYYTIVREMFQSEAAKKFFNTNLLLQMLDDHKSGKYSNDLTDNSRKIWTIYIFLVWYHRFFVCENPHALKKNQDH